jgi:hypothetical protein
VDPSGVIICIKDENGIEYQYVQDDDGKWNFYHFNDKGEIEYAYAKNSSDFVDNVLSDLQNIRTISKKDAVLKERFDYIVGSNSEKQTITKAAINQYQGEANGAGTILYNRNNTGDADDYRVSLVHELLGHAYNNSYNPSQFSLDSKNIIYIDEGGKTHNIQKEQINAINIENRYRYACGRSRRTKDGTPGNHFSVKELLDQDILNLWRKK